MNKRIAVSLALVVLVALVAVGAVLVVRSDSDGSTEAGGLQWRRADLDVTGYDGVHILDTEDGFLAVGYRIDEGEITSWWSDDGRDWAERSTDAAALLPGEFLMEVVATPTGYLATGGEAEWCWILCEGPVDRMWTSTDGSSWTRKDFDLADAAQPSPYVTGEGTIEGIAAGPGEVVLLARSVLDLDHQAILDEVAPGTDPGHLMMGAGILEPSGKAGVEYMIDDEWVRLTFEEMGLPESFLDQLGTQTVGMWHSSEGSAWSPCPEAATWHLQEHEPCLVAGPNGYLVDGGASLYRSVDATHWSETPAEAAFGIPTAIWEGHVTDWGRGWAAIVEAGMVPREGPSEGTEYFTEQRAVWTSSDGTAWTESVVPTRLLIGEGGAVLENLYGGELGLFAYVFPESDDQSAMNDAELWWSTDAATWDPIHMGTIFGEHRTIVDLTIGGDRVMALTLDLTDAVTGEEDDEDAVLPFELWVATAE